MKEINPNCLPREKAKLSGIDSLNDIELLALILGSGVKDASVFEISLAIVEKINGLANFDTFNLSELDIRGIGFNKRIMLEAMIEINKRIYNAKIRDFRYINNPEDIFNIYKVDFANEVQEKFIVVALNTRNAIIASKVLFIGTANHSMVHPRDVISFLTANNAISFLVIHNHPSDDVYPSELDVDVTNKLIEIGKLMGIPLMDHIIIGLSDFFSFKNNNQEETE